MAPKEKRRKSILLNEELNTYLVYIKAHIMETRLAVLESNKYEAEKHEFRAFSE